jgi:hypothetical protein
MKKVNEEARVVRLKDQENILCPQEVWSVEPIFIDDEGPVVVFYCEDSKARAVEYAAAVFESHEVVET